MLPFPSLGDLPDSRIKPGSPTLQADTLPSEPPGNIYYFARQRGTQWTPASKKTVCPNLERIVRVFIVMVQRGHDQLVGILLMGWW